MFGIYDEVAKSDMDLHHPDFAMGVKKTNETFEEFLSRFSPAIAPLGFSDVHKISNLRRLITDRLREKVAGESRTTYRDMVRKLRQSDMDFRQSDEVSRVRKGNMKLPASIGNTSNNRKPRNDGYTGNTGSSGGGSGAGVPKTGNSPFIYRYPQETQDRLRAEGRCFKCLQLGHRANEKNAPCKKQKPLTKDEVIARLATAGLELVGEEEYDDYCEHNHSAGDDSKN